MLTKRVRRLIEQHFYSYKADEALYKEQLDDIVWEGIGTRYDRVGGHSSSPNSDPLWDKVMRIEKLDRQFAWAAVVRYTFCAFRFEPEYDIMVELYINQKSIQDLTSGGMWESTIFRWRDKWLEYAYNWAKDLKLL